MSEKPVAHDVATAKSLVSEYDRVFAPRGLLWGVLENYRFESGVIRASAIAGTRDMIGDVALVEVRVHNPMPQSSRFARVDRTNQLLEGGCHFTAAMRAVAEGGAGVGSNRVVASAGATSHISSYMPAPDTLTASYSFVSGALAVRDLRCAGCPAFSELHLHVKARNCTCSAQRELQSTQLQLLMPAEVCPLLNRHALEFSCF